MKIKEITEEYIEFDNGNRIVFDHDQDCCEYNYADFKQLDDLAKKADFKEDLIFEAITGAGFCFGNRNNMFFVPCYSEQNGYYTTEIEIYYCGKKVLDFHAELTY